MWGKSWIYPTCTLYTLSHDIYFYRAVFPYFLQNTDVPFKLRENQDTSQVCSVGNKE